MVVDTLGDLIATLGSIDHDEIDWQNIRQATVLIQQTFRYDYPGPITDLRQRLMVVPPDYHGHQRLTTHKLRVVGQQPRDRALLRQLRQRRARRVARARSTGTSSSRPGPSSSAMCPWTAASSPDDIGFDRRFGEPSRLTLPDAALTCRRRGAARLGRVRPRSGRPVGSRVHDHFTYEWGVTSVETTAAEAWAARAGRLPGLRPLHGRPLQAVRPAGPLRVGSPAGRRRHARLGRDPRCRTRTGIVVPSRSIPRTTAVPVRAT